MSAKHIACVVSLLGCLMWPAAPVLAQAEHDQQGAASAAAEHESSAQDSAPAEAPNPMVFNPDLAVFSALVFLLLVVFLGKYAWPTIAAALDERERSIADNIAAAEAKHEEAKRLLAAHEAKLAAAAGEVRELLEEARRHAEQTKSRIVADAKQAAKDESARAIREVELAKDAAMQELAVSSANLAIDLAGKVVHEQLSKDKHNQLVREALGKLAATEPSQN
jgi:F-type H+-transporting ATPase subunit b